MGYAIVCSSPQQYGIAGRFDSPEGCKQEITHINFQGTKCILFFEDKNITRYCNYELKNNLSMILMIYSEQRKNVDVFAMYR